MAFALPMALECPASRKLRCISSQSADTGWYYVILWSALFSDKITLATARVDRGILLAGFDALRLWRVAACSFLWAGSECKSFQGAAAGFKVVKICFLIGSPEIGGGTYVIYEHALYLQERGWDVTVVSIWPPNRNLRTWHRALERLRFATLTDVASEQFDLAVVTWWRTI